MWGVERERQRTSRGVPIYMVDYFGSGRHAKVVSTRAVDLIGRDGPYREDPTLTGDLSRVAEVSDVTFPTLLEPSHDRSPRRSSLRP